jgi:chaperonin cofactor prefoldin
VKKELYRGIGSVAKLRRKLADRRETPMRRETGNASSKTEIFNEEQLINFLLKLPAERKIFYRFGNLMVEVTKEEAIELLKLELLRKGEE